MSSVPLKFGEVQHRNISCLGYGDAPECWSDINPQSFSHAPRLQKLAEELQWRESLGEFASNNTEWFEELKTEMNLEAKKAGLIKGTAEWKLRWFFNCATDLKNDKRTKHCFVKPQNIEMKTNSSTFFVCDITHGMLMHADTLSDYWMYASPPKGMGKRQYAAYSRALPPCDNVGGCPGCLLNATASINSCTVTLDPENCTLEVLDHHALVASNAENTT